MPGEPAGRGRKVALEHGCSIGTGPLRQTSEVKAPRTASPGADPDGVIVSRLTDEYYAINFAAQMFA